MTDAERYVVFFNASLIFFNSYDDLQILWREQRENRIAVGVTPKQEREMARACAARRHVLEANLEDDEIVPVRPGRAR